MLPNFLRIPANFLRSIRSVYRISCESFANVKTTYECLTITTYALPSIGIYCDAKAPVTPGLRPGYDLPATEKWANRRNNVRLVAEVVRLVAEVVGDRKGQISRNKVDGHAQNLKPAIPNRKRSHD